MNSGITIIRDAIRRILMEKLRLHAKGMQDHLEVLRAEFHRKVRQIAQSKEFTRPQREAQIREFKKAYRRQKASVLKNLY